MNTKPAVSTAGLEADLSERAKLAPIVRGRCPACGWQALFLGRGGHVTCSMLECDDPLAADKLLGDKP